MTSMLKKSSGLVCICTLEMLVAVVRQMLVTAACSRAYISVCQPMHICQLERSAISRWWKLDHKHLHPTLRSVFDAFHKIVVSSTHWTVFVKWYKLFKHLEVIPIYDLAVICDDHYTLYISIGQ